MDVGSVYSPVAPQPYVPPEASQPRRSEPAESPAAQPAPPPPPPEPAGNLGRMVDIKA